MRSPFGLWTIWSFEFEIMAAALLELFVTIFEEGGVGDDPE